jgi:hypothetical protein
MPKGQRSIARGSVRAAVLPAWATVTLAIVTGIAAGYIVTVVRIRFDRAEAKAMREHERLQQEAQLAHERDEQWRGRLVDAAAEFSTGAQQALSEPTKRSRLSSIRATADPHLPRPTA